MHIYSFRLLLLLEMVHQIIVAVPSKLNYFETLIHVHMSIVPRCKIDLLRRVQASIETNTPSL